MVLFNVAGNSIVFRVIPGFSRKMSHFSLFTHPDVLSNLWLYFFCGARKKIFKIFWRMSVFFVHTMEVSEFKHCLVSNVLENIYIFWYLVEERKSYRFGRFYSCFCVKTSWWIQGNWFDQLLIWSITISKDCFLLNIFENIIYSCDANLKFKRHYLLQSSVSHDPSEIFLIGWFAVQKTILMLKTAVSLHIFVETIFYFYFYFAFIWNINLL